MTSYGMLYKHLKNGTFVDVLMFSFYGIVDVEVLCFILLVKKAKDKVFKFDMM